MTKWNSTKCFHILSVSWRILWSPHSKPDEWVWFDFAATGSLFKWIETGSRHPADAAGAKFFCQDIFCGETHNMLVAKITFTQPTHKTDRWYWMISQKPRLRSLTTFWSVGCQTFSTSFILAMFAHHKCRMTTLCEIWSNKALWFMLWRGCGNGRQTIPWYNRNPTLVQL